MPFRKQLYIKKVWKTVRNRFGIENLAKNFDTMGSKLKKKQFFFGQYWGIYHFKLQFFKKNQQQKFDLSMEDVPLRE